MCPERLPCRWSQHARGAQKLLPISTVSEPISGKFVGGPDPERMIELDRQGFDRLFPDVRGYPADHLFEKSAVQFLRPRFGSFSNFRFATMRKIGRGFVVRCRPVEMMTHSALDAGASVAVLSKFRDERLLIGLQDGQI